MSKHERADRLALTEREVANARPPFSEHAGSADTSLASFFFVMFPD